MKSRPRQRLKQPETAPPQWERLRFDDGGFIEMTDIGDADHTAVLWLHPIEYPGQPGPQFLSAMTDAQFRLITLRRPGFGKSTPLSTMSAQVGALAQVLDILELEDVVIVASGTAAPAAIRLTVQDGRIRRALLVNYAFGSPPPELFRTDWLDGMLTQGRRSRATASLMLAAIKLAVRRGRRSNLYWDLWGQSLADRNFLHGISGELHDAESALLALDTASFMLELSAADELALTPQQASRLAQKACAVFGADAGETFVATTRHNAARFGLDVHQLPFGDRLAAYVNGPDWIARLL